MPYLAKVLDKFFNKFSSNLPQKLPITIGDDKERVVKALLFKETDNVSFRKDGLIIKTIKNVQTN